MKKFCLSFFIVWLNLLAINNAFAQSGRIKQEPRTNPPPQIEGPISDAPPRKMSVIIPLDTSSKQQEIPDYIVYETVFHLAQMGWTPTKEREFSPLDLIICRKYKMKKILNEKQEKALRVIAYETITELDKIAQQAKKILKEFRANLPNLRPQPGETRPALPPELEELQAKKLALIDGAIEKLKTSFGEKDFAKFTEFVDENVRSNFRTGTIPIQ